MLRARESAANELAITCASEGTTSMKVIDRTFIEDGTRWIIDYKSVMLASDISDAALAAVAEQHREQLDGYAQLFNAESLPLAKAIFFVSIGRLVKLK